MLKKSVVAVLTIALLGAAVLGGAWLIGQMARPAEAQSTPAPAYNTAHTITVVGQGSAKVDPDVARISAGVETTSDTVAEAVAENQATMKAILEAVKAVGIVDKDIQTTNYSIYLERLPEPIGSREAEPKFQYRVSNMVSVTIRDLDKVGDVLDAVVEAGANNIWGVSFGVDDIKPAQSEARAAAMADAEARASELAKLGKVTLGPILSLSEVVGSTGVPTLAMVERAVGTGDTISPGQVEVSYQVQVVYYLEP